MPNPPDPRLILIAGAALLYSAGRAASYGLARRRPALAQCLPIAATAAVAVFFDQPEVAVAIILATSVASLSLIAGCVILMGGDEDQNTPWPPRTRTTTALLLPATVLTFLAGFSGQFGWLNIAILAVEGIALCMVWSKEGQAPPSEPMQIRPFFLLIALILAAGGAIFAIFGAIHAGSNLDFPAAPVVASAALGPLIVSPMLVSGAHLVQNGRAWAAAESQAAVAQLNLCALLPATAIFWRLYRGQTLIYPIANWRVEGVTLMVLAGALLPAAAGWWKPGKLEGLILVLIYGGYVLAVVAAALPA